MRRAHCGRAGPAQARWPVRQGREAGARAPDDAGRTGSQGRAADPEAGNEEGDGPQPCGEEDDGQEVGEGMTGAASLAAAVDAFRAGGVIAYPTEAVYGLGCDPHNHDAFAHLFTLKQRLPTQGVLLIGAAFDHVAPFIELAAVPATALAQVQATWPGPHTWVFPRAANVPGWIAGNHAGIALRVTAHPVAAALCRACGGAIVSTSANRHGGPPARTAAEVRAIFGDTLAAVVPGEVGNLATPTPIRDALTGVYIRT